MYLLRRGRIASECVDWEADGPRRVLCEGIAKRREVHGDAHAF